MYYDEYLTCLAKTQPALTLFEHSSDVLQVVNYLIEQNAEAVNRPDMVRAAALLHDIGKIKGDRSPEQWIHAPHSSVYLEPLLADSRFQSLMSGAGIDADSLDHELLLMICEEHHNPSPKLLRLYKEALLISAADALASSIASGTVGSIADIMRSNPYMQINLELVRSLGFDKGWDRELHHIDLPGQFTEDLFLADMIFRLLDKPLHNAGITPLLQRRSSLWVVGTSKSIRSVLNDITVNPKEIYEIAFDEGIYETILSQFPPGAKQIDILSLLLVNEPIALKMAIALYTRDKSRKLFERNNLSHLVDKASRIFASGIREGIDSLWSQVAPKLLELAPHLDLPSSIAEGVEKSAADGKRRERALFAKPKPKEKVSRKARKVTPRAEHNREVLKRLQSSDKQIATDIEEFLKLFDYSENSYRSLTNIYLELLKMKANMGSGAFSLPIAYVTLLDGEHLEALSPIPNALLCPICRRFAQEIESQSLITGRSEGDSKHFEFRRREGAIRICRWCFIAGYVDLPIANVISKGNSVIKEREYLLVTSPQPKNKLQWLVDFARRGRSETTEEEQQGGDEERAKLDAEEVAQLEAMMGIAGGYDELGVLGVSRRQLSNLKGFVLPTCNAIENLVGIRIPFERLVGEDKVSGAVRRELVKATMYDLHQVTGAPSMHYNVISNAAFSVDGRPTTLEEMRRANIAYRLAYKDNFCRHFNQKKHIWQLNSGLYMLLLRDPRIAANLALRKLQRNKRAPGEQRIKEVIELVESIAQTDWKFDLGQRIVSTLINIDLLPKARSFWKNPQEQFSGVELTKWLQRLKMAHDETGVRQWGNQLINALKAGRVASREFKETRGISVNPPGEETINKVVALVNTIISECKEHKCKFSEFVRDIAEMDYYLLFYYNQKTKEAKQ